MSEPKELDLGLPTVASIEETGLVVRSAVPSGRQYLAYRPYLRYDFFYSCAYCSITEAEAKAVHFTIDHYEPRAARPDLEHSYTNLMWSCNTCNQRKGDRCPPEAARKDGHRFFRPDEDHRNDHFENGALYNVKSKTNVGGYTIEFLDLNRRPLKVVRELRERLLHCHEYVMEGISALRRFPLDTLPKEMRLAAKQKIGDAMLTAQEISAAIDSVLQEHARSALLDPDPEEPERARTRAEKLKELQALYPGNWRAPRRKRQRRR